MKTNDHGCIEGSEALLRWARDGDRGALAIALAAAEPIALARARGVLGPGPDAEDAAQEALLQVLRLAHRYRGDRPFAAWICHLTRLACLRLQRTEKRRRRREHEVAVPASAPASVTPSPDEETETLVRAAVSDLPASLRGPVELFYLCGLSQREAAQSLGIAENALAVRLHRARKRLAQALTTQGVSVSAVTLATGLVPRPADASVGLSERIAALADNPPSSTIPLSPVQEALCMCTAHPLLCSVVVMLIAASVVSSVMIATEPQPLATPSVEHGPFSGPAAEVLQWVQPDAAVHLAIDINYLRRTAVAVAPLSALADPQLADSVATLRELAGQSWLGRTAEVALNSGQGLVMNYHDNTSADRAAHRRMMLALGLSQRVSLPLQHAPVDEHSWHDLSEELTILGGHFGSMRLLARESVLVIGQNIGDRGPSPTIGSGADMLPQTPGHGIHLRADFGPLMHAYAEASPDDADPAQLGYVLDVSEWRSLRPVLSSVADIDEAGWWSRSELTQGPPLHPLRLVALVTNSIDLARLSGFLGPMRPLASRYRPFDVSQEMVTVELGTEIRDHQRNPGFYSIKPSALEARLWQAFSGDLRLSVRPGSMWPEATLVIGMHSTLAVPDLTLLLTDAFRKDADSGPWQHRWRHRHVAALWIGYDDDRVVISLAQDPHAGRGGGAERPSDAGDGHLRLDLPRLVAAVQPWLGLASLIGAQDLAAQWGTLAPVIQRHAPVYHVDWQSTEDGFVLHERGLPLLPFLLAKGAGAVAHSADPGREVTEGMLLVEARRTFARHRALLDLLVPLRTVLERDPPPVSLDAALRAAGIDHNRLRAVLPGQPDQPSRVGTWRVGTNITGITIDDDGNIFNVSVGGSFASWAIPLGNDQYVVISPYYPVFCAGDELGEHGADDLRDARPPTVEDDF